MKMNVVVDDVDGVVPLYDKDKGKPAFYASTRNVKRAKKSDLQIMVPMFPVTAELFRAMADTLDLAQKEGRFSAVMVVSTNKNLAGLLSV